MLKLGAPRSPSLLFRSRSSSHLIQNWQQTGSGSHSPSGSGFASFHTQTTSGRHTLVEHHDVEHHPFHNVLHEILLLKWFPGVLCSSSAMPRVGGKLRYTLPSSSSSSFPPILSGAPVLITIKPLLKVSRASRTQKALDHSPVFQTAKTCAKTTVVCCGVLKGTDKPLLLTLWQLTVTQHCHLSESFTTFSQAQQLNQICTTVFFSLCGINWPATSENCTRTTPVSPPKWHLRMWLQGPLSPSHQQLCARTDAHSREFKHTAWMFSWHTLAVLSTRRASAQSWQPASLISSAPSGASEPSVAAIPSWTLQHFPNNHDFCHTSCWDGPLQLPNWTSLFSATKQPAPGLLIPSTDPHIKGRSWDQLQL